MTHDNIAGLSKHFVFLSFTERCEVLTETAQRYESEKVQSEARGRKLERHRFRWRLLM